MPIAATIRLFLSAAFALLLFAAPAVAADRVKITDVSVGFPSIAKDRGDVSKFGAWVPVYATLEVTGDVREPAELFIEAPDSDEVATTLAVPLSLAGVAPGTKVFAPDRGCVGYVRPAGASTEVTVTVRSRNGSPISEPFRVKAKPREPLQYIVLAIGGAPDNFELPKLATPGAEAGPLRNGRVELAHLADYARLPTQWFGYEAADLVLLNTGTASADFLTKLFGSKEPADARKRDALIEWVRRGGRLVVSVGANAKAASELPKLAELLPYAINAKEPSRDKPAVALYWSAGLSSQTSIVSGALDSKGGAPLVLAKFVPQPNRSARVLIPPASRQTDDPEPVAVQSAFGLGRVTVIGFDLDRAPFSEVQQRQDFWDWVLRECGANRASSGGDGKARPPGALTEDEDEASVALRAYNDSFDGVAVVSFGWVAVLIVLYIILIGPVEYYFLKRVLRRLELTWVTFPIIVLTVSIAAYLTADAVKGRELKVNKIDVVDVDANSDRIYGTTYFTVFSPKIDNYSVAVTPGNEWGDGDGAPEVNSLGTPRGGRPGVVKRKYGVHADDTTSADRLENVPIQVWSTKAFSANWSSVVLSGRDKLPAVVYSQPRTVLLSDLVHPPRTVREVDGKTVVDVDRTKVIGTFTSHLPAPTLTDCVAFYGGQAYPLPGGIIAKGERVRLVFDQGTPATQWLQSKGESDTLLNFAQSYRERPGLKTSQKQQQQAQTSTGPVPMWTVLFHEATLKNEEGVVPRNASLRRLDQSWRLAADNRDEVIIIGRAAPPPGPAEEVLTGPNAPSKLWLKSAPGTGDRWKIPGTARQETWVRFYLPVR